MRKYDVAYVPNGPLNVYPAPKLEDMSLDEIVNKYIRNCGKANGQISVCSKCATPCREGRRAVQLLANTIYNDPPIPLYGGKTLIEKAREENMKRREKMEAENNTEKKIEKKAKRTVSARYEGWWDDSIASGDQVKWLMENYGLSKTQAKKKIYAYKYNHKIGVENVGGEKEEKPAEEKPVVSAPVVTVNESNSIESKLEALMKKQEEHKQMMAKYMALYEAEKDKYEKLKLKVDTLCNAMDIMNE